MARVLVSAFDPYDVWTSNASWLALVELTKDFPSSLQLVTRRYPVDFERMMERLAGDLQQPFDYVVMLGQAPGRSDIQLEAIGLNRRNGPGGRDAACQEIVSGGPLAYATQLPVAELAAEIRGLGIPCSMSYHAGTYLCNAAYYWALHLIATRGLPADALFVHLPLAPPQVVERSSDQPSMSSSVASRAIRALVERLASIERLA